MDQIYFSLKIGNTLAHFIALGNCPVCMPLLLRIAIVGQRLFIASMNFLGPSPSNPVAFDGAKAFM